MSQADFWDRGPVKPTSEASQANPTQTSRQPASPMAAHTFALAGTQRPDTSGQLMGTAALLSATQQASKALSPKAFKPLAARLSAAASLDGIPLGRLLRQQVDAETGKDEYGVPILPQCTEWNYTRQKLTLLTHLCL